MSIPAVSAFFDAFWIALSNAGSSHPTIGLETSNGDNVRPSGSHPPHGVRGSRTDVGLRDVGRRRRRRPWGLRRRNRRTTDRKNQPERRRESTRVQSSAARMQNSLPSGSASTTQLSSPRCPMSTRRAPSAKYPVHLGLLIVGPEIEVDAVLDHLLVGHCEEYPVRVPRRAARAARRRRRRRRPAASQAPATTSRPARSHRVRRYRSRRMSDSFLDSRSLRSSLVPRCDPHSRSSSGAHSLALPLAPVLARSSLRSSLAFVFGALCQLLFEHLAHRVARQAVHHAAPPAVACAPKAPEPRTRSARPDRHHRRRTRRCAGRDRRPGAPTTATSATPG